ncbi:flagellar hook-basal body complex protein [Bermanella marisrubri]|uniref:Flagellar hook protein FlgE n=1 Tax=Bermanella marisrubri TaxID=207949 RepID=Q1N302_9GAMM|nr:flagellar hook-basal body complex protein [Bermanella marisrubri]EAT12517.1 Flagellar hook protein FlgE [Oceanobacter sp. RED65] [Bermanella marisrubri]QIZ84923.1 flagellar hook-basal body complex protein [Bermanella marisrubri]
MAFNIGLSGIRAASTDLEVTGNNVANASTVGFKESRAEFADVYTTTILGTGSKPVGSGVLVDNVRQEFSQGNISGTENALDMAIDGNGFFILNDNGTESYTRAGIFGLDKDGFVVANSGARLQGYEANGDGVVNGVLGDVQIRIGNQPPSLTSRVSSIINVDASELVKQELGSRLTSDGLAVAAPDAGIADSTSTVLSTVAQPTTAGNRTALTFDNGGVDLSAQANVVAQTDPGAFGVTIDPFDGTGAQVINIPAGTVTIGATPTQHLQNILNALQSEIDAVFGNNEFEVSTNQSPLTAPLVAGTNLVIERAGFDATTGTSFSVTAPTGAWNGLFGDPAANTNVTAGVAGNRLFVGSNPLTADFRSIPGTSTTTRTTATPPLAMTGFIAGDHAQLSSTIANGGTVIGDFGGANSVVFDIEVTDINGTTTTQTITLDNAQLTDGVEAPVPADINNVTMEELRAEIQGQIGAGALAGLLNVSPGHPMSLTANTADNGDTIVLVPNAASSTYNLNNIGFATTNRTDTGDADIDPNNEFRIQVTGPTAADDSNAYNIIIPQGTYATLDDLASAIQTEIDLRTGANGLAGRVTVQAVGGQLVFTNTEEGVGYGVTFTPSTGLSAAQGLSALEALELDNPSVFLGTDEIDRSNSFRVTLTVPAPDEDNRSGTTTITLDEEYRSVQQVAASINRQINSLDSDAFIGVRAEAVEIEPRVVPPEYKLRFVATEEGEASTITISDFIATGDDVTTDEMYGLIQIDEDDNSLLTQGIEGVNNEYPAQTVTLTTPEGDEIEITTEENAEANEIASIFNRQAGVTASASSELTIPLSGYNNPGNNMKVTLNGQELESTSLADMVEEINGLTTTTLPGFSAELNENGDMIIKNSIGRDIKVEIDSPTVTDSLVIQGSANAGPVVLGGTATADTAAVVGGTIEFIFNEGYTISNPIPSVSGVFGALSEDEFEDYVLNVFDAQDQDTYNHATSTTIYDSLGNSHIMTQYFVREPLDPTRPNEENVWAMYVQIDGKDVGDPDSTLPFPDNLEPTQFRQELFFNPDGTFDQQSTGPIFVTNWDPVDEEGSPTGALKSQNVLEGGLPLNDPPTNSNFEILLEDSSQFGSPFSVSEVSQNGYTTGRLTGLEIDADGFIFARFTNGQAEVLGQVALASFKNPEGLIPLGDTAWGESFESGTPTVGSPRTGTFGNLRSSALEDSNVDLSEELVGLIIAQRNFQASAKTIETSDTVTQTIIQL